MSASGVFIAIVGPSGAGKDSLIKALAGRLPASELFVVRRVITRPSDPSEDHDTLDDEAFDAAQQAGRFALSWDAHGLKYGVPIAVNDAIADGKIVICNLSRRAVVFARERFKRCLVVEVTASDEILRARLAARGRETAEARAGRFSRAHSVGAEISPDATIRNDGALEGAAEAFAVLVRQWRRELSEA